MNWFDRILLCGGTIAFFTLCYLMFFSSIDAQKKTQNMKIQSLRLESKMIHLSDLISDLKELSKNLQVNNALINMEFEPNKEFVKLENTFKISMISEILDIKANIMSETLKEATEELKRITE